jgi:hypothetical protein
MKPELVTSNDSDRPLAFRRLSAPQKWEIVRLFSAGLLSTVLFAAPMFLARPTHNLAAVPRPVAAAPGVRVLSEIRVVPMAAEPLRAIASSSRSVRTATTGVPRADGRRTTTVAHAERSWQHRFVRAVAGDGRYPVRPFPSVESSER